MKHGHDIYQANETAECKQICFDGSKPLPEPMLT